MNQQKFDEYPICEIHNIHMTDIEKQYARDPDAVEGDTFVACVLCVEQYLAELDTPDQVQKAININRDKMQENPLNLTYIPGIIERLSGPLSENTNVPKFIAEAALEFLIGTALYNVHFSTLKGRVRANEWYRHMAESGHDKTTIYNYLRYQVIPEAFRAYDYYVVGAGTVKGYSSMLEKDFKKHGERIIPVFFMKDEDNELYIDDRGNKYNKVFQGYSNMYNGIFPSGTTITNGDVSEKKAFVIGWTNGTPSSISDESPERFTQGFGWRQLILMDESPISKHPLIGDVNDYNPEIPSFHSGLIDALKQMQKIRFARVTEAFKTRLTELYHEMIDYKNEMEKDGSLKEMTLEWVKVESRTKVPEHIIKLAMIHAASRRSIDGEGFLVMDIPDFEYARRKFEFYAEMTVKFYKLWITKKRSRDIDLNLKKLIQVYQDAKYRARMESEKDEKGEMRYTVVPDPEGSWVSHSYLLKRTKFNAGYGPEGMDTIVQTLKERHELFEREAWIPSGKDAKLGKMAKFYSMET